jgi:hypothetical protein
VLGIGLELGREGPVVEMSVVAPPTDSRTVRSVTPGPSTE